jgi:hypothetical protein
LPDLFGRLHELDQDQDIRGTIHDTGKYVYVILAFLFGAVCDLEVFTLFLCPGFWPWDILATQGTVSLPSVDDIMSVCFGL